MIVGGNLNFNSLKKWTVAILLVIAILVLIFSCNSKKEKVQKMPEDVMLEDSANIKLNLKS